MVRMLSVTILLFIIVVGCQNSISTGNATDRISFRSDKTSYSISDTIDIILKNESYSKILIGLRCGGYLEMFYQKKEENIWSDNLSFWYMSLRCLTVVDTLESNNIFNYSLESAIFDSTGTYRLVLKYYRSSENIERIEYSNSFEIK